jgi:hypothetical protein
MAGLNASGDRLGLTYSVATKRVHEMAGGLLTMEEAARSSAQALSAGFKTTELEKLTQVAKDTSFALGRNMTDSMDRLTRGVIKLEPELLDELGIMVRIDEASRNYARQLGKTTSELTLTEKNQGFMNAVLEQGTAKFGDISKAAGDTTAIDKLGATFLELSNDVLTAINLIAKPIATLFSSSPIALLGALALFAGSIKGQVLPGIVEAGKEARAEADRTSAHLKESAAANAANLKGTAFERLRKGEGDPRNLELQVAHSVGIEQRKIAEASEKTFAWSQQEVASRKENLSVLQKQLILTRQLQVAGAEQKKASGTAKAIEATGSGNFGLPEPSKIFAGLGEAFAGQKAEVENYRRSMELSGVATTGAAKASDALKIGLYRTATAAKVAGAALLNMLPFVGTLIFVVGLLVTGFQELYYIIAGKGSKAAAEALKDLSTITKKFSERSAELLRIQQTQPSLAIKQVDSNVLISNSINEIADAYNRAAAARDAIRPYNKGDFGLGSITQDVKDPYTLAKVGDPNAPDIAPKNTKVDGLANMKALQENSPEAKAIKAFLSSDLPAVSDTARKALIELANKGVSGQALLRGAIKETTATLGGLGDASKAVQSAFKEADKAVADFSKSMTPTTPYDNMVKGLDKVNTSLTKFVVEAAKSGRSVEDLSAILTGVGPELQNLLKTDTSKAITNLKEQSAIATELTAKSNLLKQSGKELEQDDKDRLSAANLALDLGSQKVVVAQQELSELKAQFDIYQNQAIVGQSLVALAQARVNKLNTFEARSGSQIKQRMQAENAVLAMQANQVLLQVKAIELLLTAVEFNIKNNTALEDANKIIEEILHGQKQVTAEGAIQVLQNQVIANLEQKKANAKTDGGRAYYDNLNKPLIEQIGKLGELKDLEADAEAKRASANAGRNQAAAILAAATSAALQNSRAAAESAKLQLEDTQKLLALTEAIVSQKEKLLAIDYQIRGVQETSLEAVNKAIRANETLRSVKIKQINAEYKSAVAEEKANAQAIRDASASDEEAQNRINLRLNMLDTERKQKMAMLDIEEHSNILAALKLKTNEEIRDTIKEQRSSELSLIQSANELADINREISEIRTRAEASKTGRTLTAMEERNILVKSTREQLAAAERERDLKIEVINMERDILQAKTEVALQEAAVARAVIKQQFGADDARVKSYDGLIAALEKATGKKVEVALEVGQWLRPQDDHAEAMKAHTTALNKAAGIKVQPVVSAAPVATNAVNNTSSVVNNTTVQNSQTVEKPVTIETAKKETALAVTTDIITLGDQAIIEALQLVGATIAEAIKSISVTNQITVQKEAAIINNVTADKPTVGDAAIVKAIESMTTTVDVSSPVTVQAAKKEAAIINNVAADEPTIGDAAIVKAIESNNRILDKSQVGVEPRFTEPKPSMFEGAFTKSIDALANVIKNLLGYKVRDTVETNQSPITNSDKMNQPVINTPDQIEVVTRSAKRESPIVANNTSDKPTVGETAIVKAIMTLAAGAVDRLAPPSITEEAKNSTNDVSEVVVSDKLSTRAAPTISTTISGSEQTGTIAKSGAAQIEVVKANVKKIRAQAEAAALNPLNLGPEAAFAEQIQVAVESFTEALANLKVDSNGNVDPFEKMKLGLEALKGPFDAMMLKFEGLGPQGEIVQALGQGMFSIASNVLKATEVFKTAGNDAQGMADRITAGADIAQSALTMISSIVASSAKVQTDAIDKQIATEQARDGKSAESIAKISALEKKKDAIGKKAFETNKKLQIAQAIISTASAVAQTYAATAFLGPLAAGSFAAIIGALGAAQIAIIAGSQYQSTASAGAVAQPSTLSIGKRNDSVDLAKSSVNAGSEAAYVTGAQGYGNNSYNFRRAAYGANDNYGHAGMIVGEKGPEIITPQVPVTVTPNNKIGGGSTTANINISAVDAEGVEKLLNNKRGYIIQMLREAANSNGENFLESVNVQTYARRGGSKL